MGLTKGNLYQKHKLILRTSWDDGSKFDWKVWRLLKKYDVKGTFYVVTDWVGEFGYLTWDQIQQIDRHHLGKIGGHTMMHPSDLKQLYDDELQGEIAGCKGILESVLRHKVTSFCYPRGRYDKRVMDVVNEAGFIDARTTKVGSLTKPENELETATTVHVYNSRTEYEGLTWLEYAYRKLDEARTMDEPIFHLWGHGWEIEKQKQWNELKEFLQYVKTNFDVK